MVGQSPQVEGRPQGRPEAVIPPVDGTVHVVKAGETLAKIADSANVVAGRHRLVNGLTSDKLIVGQTLILPGARRQIADPEAAEAGRTADHSARWRRRSRPAGPLRRRPVRLAAPGGTSASTSTTAIRPSTSAPYGSRIIAAAAGTVIFAGWKNNGGGYQVWIAHGSGLYTTYNHMSAITVGRAHVGRGQQVGRVGQTGWATGPHLHFEVWRGEVWGSGTG